MSSLEKLCQIPIYRLLLNPESLLLKSDSKQEVINLLKELPNHDNINHLDRIKHKSEDYYPIYYKSILLIETKVFCNNLIKLNNLNKDSYNKAINDNDIDFLFVIIRENKLIFFKSLVKNDVQKYNLNRGKFYVDFNKAENIEKAISILKSYQIGSRLISSSLNELRALGI